MRSVSVYVAMPQFGRAPAGFLVLCAVFSLASGYEYIIKRISVPVDHFSYAKADTFQLRYLVNDTWWDKKNGPIFFYTGNEGDIELFADNTGFMWDIAPEFKALVVFAEHRYYGQSLPYGNKSLTDLQYLGYLTSQQALADFVDVIAELRMNQTYPKSPVIAFGGSYGGMLSAWIRMKYPHIVDGAIAASAPVLMPAGLTPCDAFNRIVTTVYNAAAPGCTDNIRRSWAALRNISANDAGKVWLSHEFSLKKPIKTSAEVESLLAWLSEAYIDVCMANYPYPANFLGDMPANPVNAVCEPLKKPIEDDQMLAKAIFKGISVYFNYTGKAQNLDINNTDSKLDGYLWDFQSCTEMAMPMCSDGKSDMFEKEVWDAKKYSDDCNSRWKVRPTMNIVGLEFGGNDLSAASNIIFSNGLMDPWASGGVLRNMSSSVLALIIPEGAHHLDLRSSNVADPVSVRRARKFHRKYIRRWIEKHRALADQESSQKQSIQDRHHNILRQEY